MRRVVLHPPRRFVIEDVAIGRPGPGEALVKVRAVGVCGSDVHLYRTGRIGDIVMEKPLVIGHECMGEVVDVGPGGDRQLAGKRVAIEPQTFCGRCKWCTRGDTNLCPAQTFLGLPPTDGAMQEYIVHPAQLLVPLPDAISDSAGVALEPMAIALHALNLIKIRPPQTVVILGTGVLGTAVLMMLGLHRNLRIVCVDVLADRLERASALGANATVQAQPHERTDVAQKVLEAVGAPGADIVFECAGADETLFNMCEVAAPGAQVVVIGTSGDDRVSFSSGSARRRGLTMRFVRRSRNTLRACIELAQEGRVRPETIVTHTFAASETAKAFEAVDQYKDGVLKAVIRMDQW